MTYESLIGSMEEGAKERIREVIENTDSAISGIEADATRESERIVEHCLEEARKKVSVERNKMLYLSRGEIKNHLTVERERLFFHALGEAQEKLGTVRDTPGYPGIYRKIMQEAISGLDQGDLVIHIDRRDLELCREILKEMGLDREVVGDLSTAGGVRITTGDGKITVDNTVESRFERAKEILRQEIFSLLQRG